MEISDDYLDDFVLKKDELKEICYNDDDLDDFMLKEYELRRRD